MTPDALRELCLDFAAAWEEQPFLAAPGLTTFKVGVRREAGKVFAFCALGERPLTVGLKCEPDLAVQLRAAHPEIVPGWHLPKRHWNTVTADAGLPDTLVRQLVEDSYDLVVAGLPRAQRLLLDHG